MPVGPLGTVISSNGGTRGESAYEIAVRRGFVGSEVEWLQSLKGDPGGMAGAIYGQAGEPISAIAGDLWIVEE